ncbi:hypothetical protein ACT8ZR_09215 [Neobacillus sp. M.A.Huq-85]
MEEMQEVGSMIDEFYLHRWLKESKAEFKEYQERYRVTGNRQDKFDMLIKSMEIAVLQAKKNTMRQDTK